MPHIYQGRIIAAIPDPVQREHLLRLGMVEAVPDPLPPGVAPDPEPAAPAPDPGSDAPQRPSPTASKDTWVAYTVAVGAATAEEAQQLTKDQLIGLTTG
ncbi:hypothetical protein [Nocardia niigatensis]|uniref:hypothetical protein n=1 Tax=Nocardia niigatensis TaxID=209249 RepID=UPI0012F634DF|nr:hypothetical protein [Nocardia niigatensis]